VTRVRFASHTPPKLANKLDAEHFRQHLIDYTVWLAGRVGAEQDAADLVDQYLATLR